MNSCFGPLPYALFGGPTRNDLSTKYYSAERLEVIQDLDLYFIRQIAHSLQEYDLEQKIDLEIKMREGTTKLLAACKHPVQSLEAAKSLLTSNERMTAYMSELQHRKAIERQALEEVPPLVKTEPSKAKVAVSDIRMPLIWKDTDHFKNKGDYRRFAVFCLLKVGTEIYDTVMVNCVDRSMTDITFEDVLVFNHAPFGFELKLEVYSHVLHDDMSIASTPRKIKKKISNSISRTIGRKLAASVKDELNSLDIGPKFDLVAHATLRLNDASDDIHTHDLVLENMENPRHQLPLFGHFCCRLAVQPECMSEDVLCGHLSVVQQIGNISGCRRMWCILRNFQLSMWAKSEESSHSPPLLIIPINRNTKVKTELTASSYPRSFRIGNTISGKTLEHILATDSDYDHAKWIAYIKQHCKDQDLWGHATEVMMDIPSPAPFRAPVWSRQGSLYEETPFKDSPQSSHSSSTSVLHESNNRISPPSIRSRSSSTSSAASSMSGSRHNFYRLHKGSRDLSFY